VSYGFCSQDFLFYSDNNLYFCIRFFQMKGLEEYIIPFKGLSEGHHAYTFGISGEFFEKFPSTDVRKGDLTASVDLLRRSSFMEFDIVIKGTVEVVCDRCLEYYQQPVDVNEHLYVRFGDVWAEETESVVVIPHEETQIDMGQFFYEFIMLALPYRKIHPDDKDGHATCDPEMLRRLKEIAVDEESVKSSNAIWNKLKDINLNQ